MAVEDTEVRSAEIIEKLQHIKESKSLCMPKNTGHYKFIA